MSIFTDDTVVLLCPKTGCQAVRDALQRYYPEAVNLSPFHGIPPMENMREREVLTFVRDPAFWLRSFWGDRRRSQWNYPVKTNNLIWNELCNSLYPGQPLGWDFFLDWYIDDRAGTIGWLFEQYGKHADTIGRTENLEDHLKLVFPKVEKVHVVNHGAYLPKLTPSDILRIDQVEGCFPAQNL